jgi:hypothetical protein
MLDRPVYIHRIAPDDRIEFVNEAWVQFAVDNASPTLAQRVLGTSLWNYLVGEQVVYLWKELLYRVRVGPSEATIPFRCDSPRVRRFMRMRVVPLATGAVEFGSWIEREEPFGEPIPLLDPAVPLDPDAFLRMCAWCKQIDAKGYWLEIEEAVERLRLFDRPALPALTHGMCERCFRMIITSLRPS